MDEKYAHPAGIDVDIVVAYGYPAIAAMDTLLHLCYYTSDDVSEKDLSRLVASLLVTRLSTAAGVVILLKYTTRTKMRTSTTRELIFCTMGCLFSTAAIRIFDLEYMYYPLPLSGRIIAVVSPLPVDYAKLNHVKESAPDCKLKALVDSNWSPQHSWNFGMPPLAHRLLQDSFWDFLAFWLTLTSVMFVGLYWLYAWIHGKVRVHNRLPLAFCLFLAFVSKAGYYIAIELSVMLGSLCLHPSLALPQTSAALSDLDQMSTLILSGVLIIAGCVWDLYLNSLWARLHLMPAWLSRYRLPEGYHLLE